MAVNLLSPVFGLDDVAATMLEEEPVDDDCELVVVLVTCVRICEEKPPEARCDAWSS